MYGKIALFVISVSLSGGLATIAQAMPGEQLAYADSLFDAKKYTESYEVYDHLLEVEKVSSSAMLLRMAFIREGLGDYSGALYYLNTYYLKTADRKVLTKMEELAEKEQLDGYEFTDFDFLRTNFYKYFDIITYGLLALSVLMLSLTYYQKFKRQQNPILPASLMVVFLGILFYTLNFGRDYNKAIVSESNTYLMSGPSAGAEVIDILDKGHRIDYRDQQDVWVRIAWKDKTAFVKRDKLRYIGRTVF